MTDHQTTTPEVAFKLRRHELSTNRTGFMQAMATMIVLWLLADLLFGPIR